MLPGLQRRDVKNEIYSSINVQGAVKIENVPWKTRKTSVRASNGKCPLDARTGRVNRVLLHFNENVSRDSSNVAPLCHCLELVARFLVLIFRRPGFRAIFTKAEFAAQVILNSFIQSGHCFCTMVRAWYGRLISCHEDAFGITC